MFKTLSLENKMFFKKHKKSPNLEREKIKKNMC